MKGKKKNTNNVLWGSAASQQTARMRAVRWFRHSVTCGAECKPSSVHFPGGQRLPLLGNYLSNKKNRDE